MNTRKETNKITAQKLGAVGALGLVAAGAVANTAPAYAQEEAPAVAQAAAAVSPSVISAVDFITNTNYGWDSANNQLSFTLSGINAPGGTNTMKNGDELTIETQPGVALNFTGTVDVPDVNGVNRFSVTRTSPTTMLLKATNVEGVYNVNAKVTVPTIYNQDADTTESGKSETRPGYITVNGTKIDSGEDLTFTKPVALISSNAFIYDQGFDVNAGKYKGEGTRTFEPQGANGDITLTFKAPEGTRVDTSKNFTWRTNNPASGVTDWRWGPKANPNINFEVLELTEKGYTVKLSGVQKGDQGYVNIPLIFDEIKEVYPDVAGETTHTTGRQSTEGQPFRPNGYDAASAAQNAKIEVKTYVNDSNPTSPTGKTSDGQNSDANTAEEPVHIKAGTETTWSVVVTNPGVVDWAEAAIQDETGKTVDTIKVAPGGKAVWVHKETSNNPTGKTYTAVALDGTLKAEDPAYVKTWSTPTADVKVKTLINGEDANTPITLKPGNYQVTGEITNPNTYDLTPANTTVHWVPVTNSKEGKPEPVTLPADFKVPAGATTTLPDMQVNLPKQSDVGGYYKVEIKQAYQQPKVLGGDGIVTAEASDPAYAKALTGEITANPDSTRVRVGESVTILPLENDSTTPDGVKLLPETLKFSGEGWEVQEDGSLKHTELGVVVTYDNAGNLKVTGGDKEGTVDTLVYSGENELGDKVEGVKVSIQVYDYHVGLKAMVDGQDANTSADAVKVMVPHNQDKVQKDVVLTYDNPGTDPVTVTGFTEKNGATYTLDEPVTLQPGESKDFTVPYEFKVGENLLEFSVVTEQGVTAMDPVVVTVEQEVAPLPPKVETPTTPVVVQEKPAVVQQQKPTPVKPNTGIGYTVEVADGQELADPAGETLAMGETHQRGMSLLSVGSAAGAITLLLAGAVALRRRGWSM